MGELDPRHSASMAFRLLNLSNCQPIGRRKRVERNWELFIYSKELLHTQRDTGNQVKIEELKYKKWLQKDEEIERQMNGILSTREKSSSLLIRFCMEPHGHLTSMLSEITDHLEKAPYGHGSISYAGGQEEITDHLEKAPYGHGSISYAGGQEEIEIVQEGEEYGLVEEDKTVSMQRRVETKGKANEKIGISSTHGKEVVPGKEMQQDQYANSPEATSSGGTSISERKSLQVFESVEETGISNIEDDVNRMKISYDTLKAMDVKSCFLYCALFSKDQAVNISELVECCIEEGLISGNGADARKRGHDIVDDLIGASILQSIEGGVAVKMHDEARDLASEVITGAEGLQYLLRLIYPRSTEPSNLVFSSSYKPLEIPERKGVPILECRPLLLEGGAGLRELLPKQEEWEQRKIIALMGNELSRLPENPSCPYLLMMFLERNRRLRRIPSSFFDCMPSLKFLNLSKTKINCLPQSISNLNRLQYLILRDCDNLDELPSEVGSLGDLEVLDLRGTEINKLPDEIGKLALLRYLEVCFYGSINPNEYAYLPSELFSVGIMSTLLSLETLSIGVYPGDQRWNKIVEAITLELHNLTMLTSLSFCFPEIELLELFLREYPKWNNQLLTKFKFVVGNDVKRIVSRVPDHVEFDYSQQGQCLRFVNYEIVPHAVSEVLARTGAFYLDHQLSIQSLVEFGVGNIKGLKLCIVSECPKIQSIIDASKPAEITVFPSLEYLSVHYLWNLESIWKGNISDGSFGKLRILLVHSCPKLTYVFTSSMLPFVSNLEELVVEDCPAIERIVLHSDDSIDSENVLLSSLKKLKKLTLHHLPGLVNIWEGTWPTLEYVSFYKCPNLKKVGMDSYLKHTLKVIKAEKHWWDALEKDESSLFLDLFVRFV